MYNSIYNLFGQRPFTPMESATTMLHSLFYQLWLTLPRVGVLCTYLSNALQLIWSTTIHSHGVGAYMHHSLFYQLWLTLHRVEVLCTILSTAYLVNDHSLPWSWRLHASQLILINYG